MTSMLLALATALAFACAYIPFLNLPFGGGFTIASMLPIIIVAGVLLVYALFFGLRNPDFFARITEIVRILLQLQSNQLYVHLNTIA